MSINNYIVIGNKDNKITINMLSKYRLKCSIDTYVSPRNKLLFYGISGKDRSNNFAMKLTMEIMDETNQNVFVQDVIFRLKSSYFKDEMWMASSEPFHGFYKLLIEQLTLDLYGKFDRYCYYDFVHNEKICRDFSVSLDSCTRVRYDKLTSSVIISKLEDKKYLPEFNGINSLLASNNFSNDEQDFMNKNKHIAYNKITEIKFKLCDESKKQFLQELKDVSAKLKQIAWKFMAQNELSHYLNYYSCKTCKNWVDSPMDTVFLIKEYF